MTVEDVGIQSIPRLVQKQMWRKAANLLSQPGLVMEGLCSSSSQTKCFVVASKSSSKPCIVQQQSSKSGQLLCENSYPMWQSSKICSHCLVAAVEFSGQLPKFIEWYKNPNQNQILLDWLKLTCQKDPYSPWFSQPCNPYHSVSCATDSHFQQLISLAVQSFTQPWSSPTSAGGPKQPLPVSAHPFFVRLIFGNICVCQECRGSLRLSQPPL